MAVIRSQRTVQLKDQHRTLYGVREDNNPLLHIPVIGSSALLCKNAMSSPLAAMDEQ